AGVVRLDEVAFAVLQLRVRQLVLVRVSVFDVTDRTLDTLHIGGNAFVTLAAYADRPFDGRTCTDFALEVSIGLRQEVGPQEGRARTVRTVNDGDVAVRQLHARVERADLA